MATIAVLGTLDTKVKKQLRPDIAFIELDSNINDAPFAEACAKALLKNIQEA